MPVSGDARLRSDDRIKVEPYVLRGLLLKRDAPMPNLDAKRSEAAPQVPRVSIARILNAKHDRFSGVICGRRWTASIALDNHGNASDAAIV